MEIAVTTALSPFNLTAALLLAENAGDVTRDTIYLNCNSTAGAITINLPAISALNAQMQKNVKIFVVDTANTADTNAITVVADAVAPDLINGLTSADINIEGGSMKLEIAKSNGWAGTLYSQFGVENQSLVLAGTVAFAAVNAGAAANTIAITFAGAKPVNKKVVDVFVKITAGFASVTRPLFFGQVNFGSNTPDVPLEGTAAAVLQLARTAGLTGGGTVQKTVADVFVNISFDPTGVAVNPQDYTAGSAQVWLVLEDIPASL